MSEWICFPDDYEIMLYNKSNAMRYERDVRVFSTFQRAEISSAVVFCKDFVLTKKNRITIKHDGDICVRADDGPYIYGFDGNVTLEAGKHSLYCAVYCDDGRLPTVFVDSEELHSDGSWFCTDGPNKMIPVGVTGLTDPGVSPNGYALPSREVGFGKIDHDGKTVYDCGKEVMAYVGFSGVKGKGFIEVFYGETKEEATDTENCETLDRLTADGRDEIFSKIAKGFRYFTVSAKGNVSYDGVRIFEEYVPRKDKSEFRSSDKMLDKIWDVALYTMDLTTRLFFIDGIKRDRWVWGGDVYQSILMNRFSFFDTETAKRTLTAIFGLGKNGFSQHVNNINAYSFYSIIALKEYYDQTADAAFVRRIYPRMKKLADFCVSRLDGDLFMVGYPEDWVFVDWSGESGSGGALTYNQVLLCAALRAASFLADKAGEAKDSVEFARLAETVYGNIQSKLWLEDKGCFAYSASDDKIRRQPNAMAVFFDIATPEQKRKIAKNVLLCDDVEKITTPFMEAYELAALAKLGEKRLVLGKLKEYWGGMINEGVSTFWESYDPSEKGAEKYAMYGRKYGKSLCHAWGAMPLYIIGRSLIGLSVRDGKTVLCIDENDWIENFSIKIPVAKGFVQVEKRGETYSVYSSSDAVTLEIGGKHGTTELSAGKVHEIGIGREKLYA